MDISSLSFLIYAFAGGVVGALILYGLWNKNFLRRSGRHRRRNLLGAPVAGGMSLLLEGIKALKAHRVLELSNRRFQEMGVSTIHMVFPGGDFHITCQPENVKTMLSTDFKRWGLESTRKSTFKFAIGEGIFIAEGARWQHSRALLRPMFARSHISDFDIFDSQASHLIDAILRNDGKVDLKDLFFRLTLDTSLEFLLGDSTASLAVDTDTNESLNLALHRVEHHIGSGGGDAGIFGWMFPAHRRFVKDVRIIHAFVDKFIMKRLAHRPQLLQTKSEESSRLIFLDELVKQTGDKVRIRDEILSVLFAGRDTTASLLTNIWFVLSKRPDIWAKLQAEISILLPDGQKPTFEQLKSLKYLRAILNESLRLHPVVPGNVRQAIENTTLPSGGGPSGDGPIFIPKGGVVMWDAYAMQRRLDLYGSTACDFIPERWLDTTQAKGLRVSWESIPFGGGPRICLGQQFAINHASYTIVRMCQTFSSIASFDPNDEWQENITLGICTNLGGAKVMLRK
ncbi:cytochrome P450 [Sphaerulina musiva SO2202]|uniref:Cytochrome P450 n=1 Tax=Sphaerulina musiva (strain SO2202) TaxID=692275 RepID=M3ARI6_SPHMS|nr:cytochrome P450 [Sphaerulina musiva SO2202]EMF08099.1 cytochrome P450 [Sphaerulina musiva SO2202]